MSEVATILEQWRESGVRWVRFELPDMHGISRSKTIPIQHAGSYAETGLNMYGGTAVLDTRSDVVGGTLYHEERGYGDQLLFPDPHGGARPGPTHGAFDLRPGVARRPIPPPAAPRLRRARPGRRWARAVEVPSSSSIS